MMPGLRRTTMGVYVLEADVVLSRWVEQQHRLDIQMNIDEVAAFAHLIPEGGVVINAGACLGDHTVIYSQIVGASGHVYAFEPHPVTYEALRQNVARLSNVTTYQIALGRTNELRHLTPLPNVGASFLSPDGEYIVECRRLDQVLLPILTRCDFLQLDAEGLEPAILEGAAALIERFRPVLVVEVQDGYLQRNGTSEAAFLEQLAGLGYVVSPIAGQRTEGERDMIAIPIARAAV